MTQHSTEHSTDDRGLAGLEAAFQQQIGGQPGKRTVLRDARRGTVLDPDLSFYDAIPGENLHLTLDAALQHILERELAARQSREGDGALDATRSGAASGREGNA